MTTVPTVAVPRLNPPVLRESAPYFGPDSDAVKLTALEDDTIAVRQCFWDFDAEYNPLGQFGASFSRT